MPVFVFGLQEAQVVGIPYECIIIAEGTQLHTASVAPCEGDAIGGVAVHADRSLTGFAIVTVALQKCFQLQNFFLGQDFLLMVLLQALVNR